MTKDEAVALLRQGIWPGKSELVIGVVDDETGVIVEEYRIPPMGKMPERAKQLYCESLKEERGALVVPRHSEHYNPDQVQAALGKQRH